MRKTMNFFIYKVYQKNLKCIYTIYITIYKSVFYFICKYFFMYCGSKGVSRLT